VIAAGNLKVDAPPPRVDLAELERLQHPLAGRSLLMAASTHDGEDQIIADAHRELSRSLPDLCTIIAPRHPERGAAITDMLKGRGFKVTRRSLAKCRNGELKLTSPIPWASLGRSTSSRPSPSSAALW
jgi:3-deoxy-D-manno-octulosonic-acid transferase